MRILTGRFKGLRIRMPRGIRPTQDKVRKALFDILSDVQGLSFLDLFAGSGAVGLEALSQGAGRVVFVERDKRCSEIIRKNLAMLDTSSLMKERKAGLRSRAQGTVLLMDIFRAVALFVKNQQKFDIIFLDPPYYQELAKKTLKTLSHYDIVSANGLVISQHFKKDILPEVMDNLTLAKQARYGDSWLSFYQRIEF